MSIAAEHEPALSTFGAGGSEPYAQALRRGGSNLLYLTGSRTDEHPATAQMDVARWHADADAADLSLLRSVAGPVLDIGCGPGRMVRAALDLGLSVLGVDVSPTAIEIARESGLPVLAGSIFDELPDEGAWQTVLLVDGNIGIGGDVAAMLRRCRNLLRRGGEVVAELHPDRARDRTYTGRLVDTHGNESASFPWAEIGLDAVIDLSSEVGLKLRRAWVADGRQFCRLIAV